MLPFPFALLTWRECIVGFEPVEMVHMQVEKNWVHYNPPGTDLIGNGSAVGRNLGFVNWRMKEDVRDGRRLRMLHSESYELKTGQLKIEEVWVDPTTNAIAFQDEQRTSIVGNERSQCVFFPDRVECTRILTNGKTVVATMMPADGMEAVQRRFVPVGKDPKEFVVVDGVRGSFHRVKVTPEGRFTGNWGTDKYEGSAYRYTVDGQSYVVMLNPANEIVKIEFTKEISLALTSQPKSKRYEDNLPGASSTGAESKVKPVPTKQKAGAGT